MTGNSDVEDLLRQLAPQVLGALVRRYGHFDASEDAVQEALVTAAMRWPEDGVPEHPTGWLITVASRRLIDQLRGDSSRRRREDATAARTPADGFFTPAPEDERMAAHDDTLTLLFLCCHPALTPPSQLALTLRAVGGLTTAEIAAAFLVPEATMAQRISRAKAAIRAAGGRFELPPADAFADRMAVVLHVLYLLLNEGYSATSGPDLTRVDLTAEALRLTRLVRALLPDDGEVAGLLALMLLTEARRSARTSADGALVPLGEQDRSRWDPAAIAEGIELLEQTLGRCEVGPYQVQAAIAAVHVEAAGADDTDWAQILALYRTLERLDPNPIVTLNKAVAVGMVDGPAAGLALVDALAGDARLADTHRLDVVRAHLLERAGDREGARAAYRAAARRTTSTPEQRFLDGRAARLGTQDQTVK